MSITVIGGDLAGIAAAARLTDRGKDVTLLAPRARLGGLTHSVPARRSVDRHRPARHHALHTPEYLPLLDRLGVAEHTGCARPGAPRRSRRPSKETAR